MIGWANFANDPNDAAMLGRKMSNGRKAETKGPLYWGLFVFMHLSTPPPLAK